jgi:cob(I)alamin adenosyltransferase
MTDEGEIDREHSERMRKVQAEHRSKMKDKRKAEGGLLAVLTGPGKGKSTSALGILLRAIGWGHKVAMVQFIKGTWKTGEKQFFARFSDLATVRCMGEGFTWDTQDRQRDIAAAEAAWAQSLEYLSSGEFDLVVLDELNVVLGHGYLDVHRVLEGLGARHTRTTAVVTGRGAKQELIEAADLVTEMINVKHPFDAGIKALKGFDF